MSLPTRQKFLRAQPAARTASPAIIPLRDPAEQARVREALSGVERQLDSSGARYSLARVPLHAPGVAPPIVHRAITSAGEPLPDETCRRFESGVGFSLQHVRIHRDSIAAESAAAVGASAYAVGHHIVLGHGSHDQRTLAHELAHVAQQRAAPRSSTIAVAPSGTASECAADTFANALIAGAPVPGLAPTPFQLSRRPVTKLPKALTHLLDAAQSGYLRYVEKYTKLGITNPSELGTTVATALQKDFAAVFGEAVVEVPFAEGAGHVIDIYLPEYNMGIELKLNPGSKRTWQTRWFRDKAQALFEDKKRRVEAFLAFVDQTRWEVMHSPQQGMSKSKLKKLVGDVSRLKKQISRGVRAVKAPKATTAKPKVKAPKATTVKPKVKAPVSVRTSGATAISKRVGKKFLKKVLWGTGKALEGVDIATAKDHNDTVIPIVLWAVAPKPTVLLAAIPATLYAVVLGDYVYSDIYKPRFAKLKQALEQLASAANALAVQTHAVTDQVADFTSAYLDEGPVAAGDILIVGNMTTKASTTRESLFDALIDLRAEFYQTVRALNAAARDFSAIASRIDQDTSMLESTLSIMEQLVLQGDDPDSMWTLGAQLEAASNWIIGQIASILADQRGVVSDDFEEWPP